MKPRAAGLLLGYAADRVVGDPRRYHPVAGFGALVNILERRLYADSRASGMVCSVVLVGAAVIAGAVPQRIVSGPLTRTALTAAATWAVLGGRSLQCEARTVHHYLASGELTDARQRLARVVGRDTGELAPSDISRAAVESVAENTSDAVVAPLVWGAVAGVPGLLGYRAVNTLDAMVGQHNARYENYGWAAARLDDLVNLPCSRLSGFLTLAADPRRARQAWRAWRSDAAKHPSPNAGVVEAAFAGALGIRLGGTNQYYGNRIEHRAIMGDGRAAEPTDIVRANRVAGRVGLGAVLAAAAGSLAMPMLGRWLSGTDTGRSGTS